MTKHPAAGCSRRMIETFEAIATGQYGGHYTRTLAALERRGLVVCTKERIDVLTVRRHYHVPLPIHMQWCQWCSEQPDMEK